MEPVVNIGCAHIVMLQIIRMFPHINVQKKGHAVQGRCVLVGSGDDLKPSAVRDQPCITRTEYGEGSLFKLRFKILRTFELERHFIEEPGGLTGGARFFHTVKIEPMIEYASGVIAYRNLEMLRQTAPARQELFQRKLLKRGILIQKFVQIIYISLEMPVMVKAHCLFIDIWFQRIVSIREWCVYKWIEIVHGTPCIGIIRFLHYF